MHRRGAKALQVISSKKAQIEKGHDKCMAKKPYRDLENRVLEIFSPKKLFVHESRTYRVITSGKPTPSKGECKTDTFIQLARCDGSVWEIKISIKDKKNSEFLQNKVSACTAQALLGSNWASIITNSSCAIKDKFNSAKLIFGRRKGNVKANSITLGWKLEIANKSRSLSTIISLSNLEIIESIYMGTTQEQSKKDCYVNGIRVPNSGVANYLLETEIDEIDSPSEVISRMKSLDSFNAPPVFFIFTANNYRTKEDSADGPRPLAVYVDWHYKDHQLAHELIFNEPLKYTGELDVKPKLLEALHRIGKLHPEDLNPVIDVADEKIVYV